MIRKNWELPSEGFQFGMEIHTGTGREIFTAGKLGGQPRRIQGFLVVASEGTRERNYMDSHAKQAISKAREVLRGRLLVLIA